MASSSLTAIAGLDERALDAAVAMLGDDGVSLSTRHDALAHARALPAPGPRVGRSWKIDVGALDWSAVALHVGDDSTPLDVVRAGGEAARLEQIDGVRSGTDIDPALTARGLIVATGIERVHASATHARPLDPAWQTNKYAALNLAFRRGGAFIYVPPAIQIDEPIVLNLHLERTAGFPSIVVIAGEGSRVTIVATLDGGAFDGALASTAVEVVAEARSEVTFAFVQRLDARARTFATRHAWLGRDARLTWAVAELGAMLSVSEVRADQDEPGAQATIAGMFFPSATQHVDIASEVNHNVGMTTSETVFRTAATGHGQARFLGNIRIAAHAHGADATLRDDSLLLSKSANVDSIPALEIAANDVKAFHGATIGAIDDAEIFYAMSRGIARIDAEKMIALGFFEPAISRFPGEALRETLRDAVKSKLSA